MDSSDELENCWLLSCLKWRSKHRKIDVTTRDIYFNSPLHLAVMAGDASLVDLLLQCGADVNSRNCCDETALELALSNLNVTGDHDVTLQRRIITSLLKYGADVHTQNCVGNTLLHLAVNSRDVAIVDQLLKYGAKVNITNNNDDTPLYLAVCNDDSSIVDLLLAYGADMDTKRRDGDTLLHKVVRRRKAITVKYFLKYGSDVNVRDTLGNTPLFEAVCCGNTYIVELLLEHGADVRAKNRSGETPLYLAVIWGDASIVDRLLTFKSDVNATDEFGDTPLHVTAHNKKTYIAALLLKYGAAVNKRNRQGKTPLFTAVEWRNADMVDILVNSGANVNITNNIGNAPLHEAVRYSQNSAFIVLLLLKFGADSSIYINGNNPLHIAVILGHVSVIATLLDYGADVNSINSAGNTALHLAARKTRTDIVELLLLRGADVTIRNLDWDTPLTVARVFNFEDYEEVVNLLETAERLSEENVSSSKGRSTTPYFSNNDHQINDLTGFKYLKRAGTSGVSGQLYKTKLLCLVFIRALNDEQIERFLLGTNIRGIGDMNDICLRYRVRGQDKPVVLFVQAKHREHSDKGKLSVEDVRSAAGDFSFRKYLESYLAIRDRFRSGNEDLMFEGDFGNIECHFIIYTPLNDCFVKKTSNREINEKVHCLINTEQNTEVFQYDYDEDDIDYLVKMTLAEQIKKLGVVFLELIMSKEDKSEEILMNKLIARHHVVMGREVLTLCQIQQNNIEHRTWKFHPNFFESSCEYLLGLKNTFIRELSTKRYDTSKITDEDKENLYIVTRNPCPSTISKIIGKLVTYNEKSKNLQLVKNSDFEDSDNYETLLEQINKNIISEKVIHDAVRIQLTALEIKLPLAFGNVDMIFRGDEATIRKKMQKVADKLINLFEINKDSMVVDINDDVAGPEKSVHRDILDINDGFGSAFGNLLVVDINTNMLKLDVDNSALPKNAKLFLNELKNDKYNLVSKKLSKYRIKINGYGFPKDSFYEDDYDKKQATDFLSNLWFYTKQARENEVERILKNHINMYYNNERESNSILFEIHSHEIFLRSHDYIQKWWMQKGETYYLNETYDVFGHAKLACMKNVLLTLIDHMHFFNISSINLKINQRSHQKKNSLKLPEGLNKILVNLFNIFDTHNKSINISIENKKEILDLLQTADKILARDNITPGNDLSNTNCIMKIKPPLAIPRDHSQNDAQLKCKYFKRAGTSGVSGQLYETKLLCLVFIRALNDDEIEHFVLGTNIRDIGDMDDICLRYRVKHQDKPVVLFVQAKHRENTEKEKLTVDDLRSPFGDFSLRKYFDSYLIIKDRFQADNEDPMFKGNFSDVECNLIIYTPVEDCFTKRKSERQMCKKVHYLLNTGQNMEVFQYDYGKDIIHYLTEITTIERVKKLGIVFLELIMSDKDKSDMMLGNKLIARHHVVMGREMLQQCKIQRENKSYRVWKFRPAFFESNCKYLSALRNTFTAEMSTNIYDKSKICSEDKENLKLVVQNPCASTVSKIIGKLATYNDTCKQLHIAEALVLKRYLKTDELKTIQEQLNNIIICKNVVNEAVRIKLTALEIKLPLAFGNLDMTFRGSDVKIQRRMKTVADKLIHLFEMNKDLKIVDINDDVIGPGKSIERGIIDINGGIGSAVGNLLVIDTNTKMLKLDLDNKALPVNAALFLKELQNDKYKPLNKELGKYRIKINIDGFPKNSFNEDEFDKKQTRDFLSKLWFYTNQAKEDKVEQILKDEINIYYNSHNAYRNISDPVFLISHDEIQKWWMQVGGSSYLDRASELFERAELADIDNLLQTVINFMYVSGIPSIDIRIEQRITDYSKFVQTQQTFNKISGRLFYIFDSEFNILEDIKLPSELERNVESDFKCDIIFSLEIHPEMEWVVLKFFSDVWIDYQCYYSLIAKAGPGSGRGRAKDGFLLKEDFLGRLHYFIEGGKDPIENYNIDSD